MKKSYLLLSFCLMFFIILKLQPRIGVYAATDSPYVLPSNAYFDLAGVSPSILNASKNCCYITGYCERTERIVKTCDHHIYCFKATHGGYYEFSTIPCPGSYDPTTRSEGLYDTIGAVYTVKNGTPIRLAYSNGGNLRFYEKENGRKGCSIKVYLDKNQEVFFVVRGYQGLTGRYTLIIDANEDVTKAKEKIGSNQVIWRPQYYAEETNNGFTRKKTAGGVGMYYKEVRYLDKITCCALYQMLDTASPIIYDGVSVSIDDLGYVLKGEDFDTTKAIVDLIATAAGCIPGYGALISITYYIVNTFIDHTSKSAYSVRREIANKCGIRRAGNGLVTTFSLDNGLYQGIGNCAAQLDYLIPVNPSDYDNAGNVLLRGYMYDQGAWSGYDKD